MDMIQVSAVALLGVVASLFFKQYKPEWVIPLRLILGVVIGGMLLSAVEEVLSFVSGILATESGEQTYWPVMLKALGISFIAEIASGVCRDSGEGTLAVWVETAGKIALLILALPLMKEILETSKGFWDVSL